MLPLGAALSRRRRLRGPYSSSLAAGGHDEEEGVAGHGVEQVGGVIHPPARPVVVDVDLLEPAAAPRQVRQQHCVELIRPWRLRRGRRLNLMRSFFFLFFFWNGCTDK